MYSDIDDCTLERRYTKRELYDALQQKTERISRLETEVDDFQRKFLLLEKNSQLLMRSTFNLVIFVNILYVVYKCFVFIWILISLIYFCIIVLL